MKKTILYTDIYTTEQLNIEKAVEWIIKTKFKKDHPIIL